MVEETELARPGARLVVPAGHRPGAERRGGLRRGQPEERARRDRRRLAKDTGKPTPKISYAASSALAKQIEQGAPADIFISADLDWMDYLAEQEPDRAATRATNLLGNSIVLVAPKDSNGTARRSAGLRPRRLLGDGRLAMANVDVGAGRQVRQGGAREARRLGRASKDKVAQAENVRAALPAGRARRGAARHRLQHRRRRRAQRQDRRHLPGRQHPPIIYPVGADRGRRPTPDAEASSTYCESPRPRTGLREAGLHGPERRRQCLAH